MQQLLLQYVTAILLQNATVLLQNGTVIANATILLQSLTVVTKCDVYCKLRQCNCQ